MKRFAIPGWPPRRLFARSSAAPFVLHWFLVIVQIILSYLALSQEATADPSVAFSEVIDCRTNTDGFLSDPHWRIRGNPNWAVGQDAGEVAVVRPNGPDTDLVSIRFRYLVTGNFEFSTRPRVLFAGGTGPEAGLVVESDSQSLEVFLTASNQLTLAYCALCSNCQSPVGNTDLQWDCEDYSNIPFGGGSLLFVRNSEKLTAFEFDAGVTNELGSLDFPGPVEIALFLRVPDPGYPGRAGAFFSASRVACDRVDLIPEAETIIEARSEQVRITFPTIFSYRYRFQSNDRLGDNGWEDVRPEFVGGGYRLASTPSTRNSRQRFFRVLRGGFATPVSPLAAEKRGLQEEMER